MKLDTMEKPTGANVVRHMRAGNLVAEIPAEHEQQYRDNYEGGRLPATVEVAPVTQGGPVDMNALVAAEVKKALKAAKK